MVYLRVKPRVTAGVGQMLTLADVADTFSDARHKLGELRVSLPKGPGVWALDALPLVVQIQEQLPDEIVNVLGSGKGWLYRETARERTGRRAHDGRRALQTAAVCVPFIVGIVLVAVWTNPISALISCALGIGLGAALHEAARRQRRAAPPTVSVHPYQRESLGIRARGE